MTRLTRTFPLALTLALGLGVISCAVPPAPVLERQAHLGSASLMLVPRVVEHPAIQAVVAQPTAASIARLDMIPMVETSPGVFQPFKADGSPTALGDAQALVVSQSVPSLKLDRGITLTGLARNTKYRVLARAYDAQGKLISMDASSTVNVTVGVDDAPTSTAIPVQLADAPFAAKTTVMLMNGTSPNYASVVTTLVTVSGSTETLVPGSMQTLTKAQMPMMLALDGLMANTTYRLNASLRDAGNVEVATASAEIAVTNDDAPAGKMLAFNVILPEPAGQVSTFAGGGPSNPGLLDATGTLARLNRPSGVAVDAAGNLYVSEFENRTIRQITPQGVVTTIAGGYPTVAPTGYLDGAGSAARFFSPLAIAVDASGNLYVADKDNHAIRMITHSGGTWTTTTIAGAYPTAAAGYADGTGTNARFNQPYAIAVDASGNVYVAEQQNHAIRKLTRSGGTWTTTTIAGAYPTAAAGYADGTGTNARFSYPSGIAVDAAGNLYVTDTLNQAIRKLTQTGGTWTTSTLAGAHPTAPNGLVDGTGTDAKFNFPYGITVSTLGSVYVGDMHNHAIRKVSPQGVVTTIAGGYPTAQSGYTDAFGTASRLNSPRGLAIDASGNLYVTEFFNHVIRKIQ